MILEIDIDHDDPGYVEHRGGIALYSYLRHAGERAAHRRNAIGRAVTLFEVAETAGRPEPEVGGLALLVLQRVLLAAEDVGSMLYAFAGKEPWDRLRSARIPDLDAAFGRAVNDLDTTLAESFALASAEKIDKEATSEAQRVALRHLRDYEKQRWGRMLHRVADFWLTNRNAAKATMHGFPFVAGQHVIGPPPAGELAAGIQPPKERFAIAVTSTVKNVPAPPGPIRLNANGEPIQHKEVTTDRMILRLDAAAVADYARAGRLAARLMTEMSDMQSRTIAGRRDSSVPLRSMHRLDRQGQRALAEPLP